MNEENEQKEQNELEKEEIDPDTEAEEQAAEVVEEAEEAEKEESPEAKALAETKDQLLRTMAEYDNFRKRTAREKEALRADIIADVTSKFLPVMDNLERALSAECSDENYKNGVQMIYDSFTETLKNLGVEEIASDGEKFDPNLHQAVHREDNADAESGTVIKTFAKGYRIDGRVIRFAVVSVAN